MDSNVWRWLVKVKQTLNFASLVLDAWFVESYGMIRIFRPRASSTWLPEEQICGDPRASFLLPLGY